MRTRNNNCKFWSFLPQIASGWPMASVSTVDKILGGIGVGKQVLKYSLNLYENLEVLSLFIPY